MSASLLGELEGQRAEIMSCNLIQHPSVTLCSCGKKAVLTPTPTPTLVTTQANLL